MIPGTGRAPPAASDPHAMLSVQIEILINHQLFSKLCKKTLIYVWGNNETFGSDKQECFLWIVNHKCVYWLKIFALLWNLLLCGTCMRHACPASGTTSFYMPYLPTFTLPMLKGQHLWWSPFAIPRQVCDCPNNKRQKGTCLCKGPHCAKVHNAHCAKDHTAHCAKAHTAHCAKVHNCTMHTVQRLKAGCPSSRQSCEISLNAKGRSTCPPLSCEDQLDGASNHLHILQ